MRGSQGIARRAAPAVYIFYSICAVRARRPATAAPAGDALLRGWGVCGARRGAASF